MNISPEQAEAIITEIARLDPRLLDLAAANVTNRALAAENEALKQALDSAGCEPESD